MILNPNTDPTEITLIRDEPDGKIIRISQREFGSSKINHVYINLDDLNEFLETLNA